MAPQLLVEITFLIFLHILVTKITMSLYGLHVYMWHHHHLWRDFPGGWYHKSWNLGIFHWRQLLSHKNLIKSNTFTMIIIQSTPVHYTLHLHLQNKYSFQYNHSASSFHCTKLFKATLSGLNKWVFNIVISLIVINQFLYCKGQYVQNWH